MDPKPFRKQFPSVIEFLHAHEELMWEIEEEKARHKAAMAKLQERVALVQINYYGPNWLTTGKVGGWEGT